IAADMRAVVAADPVIGERLTATGQLLNIEDRPNSVRQRRSSGRKSRRSPRISASSRCSDTMNIEGKVIVITGAARGIGQEYARYLAGHGARVVIADINDCAQTLDLVRSEKGTAVRARRHVVRA